MLGVKTLNINFVKGVTKMKKKSFRNNNGFTLIELILGLSLLTIITISLIPLFTQGFSYIHRSGSQTDAIYKNQKTIEQNLANNPKIQNITFIFGVKEIDISIEVFDIEETYYNDVKNMKISYFKADLSD